MKKENIVYGNFYRTIDRNIVCVMKDSGNYLDGPFIGSLAGSKKRIFKMNGGGNFTASDLMPANSQDIKWLIECMEAGKLVPEYLITNSLKEY